MEDLFAEWNDTLEEVIDDLYDDKFTLRQSVPTSLSEAVLTLRKAKPTSRIDAKAALRNVQDVKDLFWKRVEANSLRILPSHVQALCELTTEMFVA